MAQLSPNLLLLWPYIFHMKSVFYAVKSKVGLLNWYNLNVYLAAIAIAYNIIELATASRRVASG